MAWWRSLRHKSSLAWRLPAADRHLLLQAYALHIGTALALMLMRYDRSQTTLRRIFPTRASSAPRTVAEVSYWCELAWRYLPIKTTCLPRSLTLWTLLNRHGLPAQFCIGVGKQGDDFAAHAWVESDGVVLNDTPDHVARYTRLVEGI